MQKIVQYFQAISLQALYFLIFWNPYIVLLCNNAFCLCLSQLIHSTVVDTAIVFPHRLGLPYKRALRNLMADHLKRIIQDNGEKNLTESEAVVLMFYDKRCYKHLLGSVTFELT